MFEVILRVIFVFIGEFEIKFVNVFMIAPEF